MRYAEDEMKVGRGMLVVVAVLDKVLAIEDSPDRDVSPSLLLLRLVLVLVLVLVAEPSDKTGDVEGREYT